MAYDAQVFQKLGKEAVDCILDIVQCGVISSQHMKDISSQLHPHVLGNHLRRTESGTACDESELRHILGDWFNQELYDLDQQTALAKLISILRGPSVSLPSVGKRLQQFLEEIKAKEKAVKIVVLLGESGTGKSSIGNCLLGLDSAQRFKVSDEVQSCTKKTEEISGVWITNGTECVIIDTPGLNDTNNQDTEHIRGMVEFLRRRGRVNSFLVVRNGHNPRMNNSFQTMLSTFELSFGEDFWNHVMIVVSHTGYHDDPDELLKLEKWKKEINTVFPKSASAPLQTVFLDAKKKGHARFKDNAERLWTLISATEIFECRDLTAVKTELDKVKALNKDLLEKVGRLEKLVGIKVSVFVCNNLIRNWCVSYLKPQDSATATVDSNQLKRTISTADRC